MENTKVKLDGYRCLRCGHIWLPRNKGYPRYCPNPECKSIYWDRPRKPKREKKP